MKHKRFAPSGASRDLACAGALALIESLPAEERGGTETIHSRRGTTAHAVGEMCLLSTNNTNADSYLDMEVEGVIVDQDIVDGIQIYIDHCRDIATECNDIFIEETGSLVEWVDKYYDVVGEVSLNEVQVDGEEMGGTGDFIGCQLWGTLHVKDYKNGYGSVEVEDNPQLLTYGLQALAKYDKEYEFEEVCLTIVQPNDGHLDGPIREWRVTPSFVYHWADNVLMPGYEKCLEAVNYFRQHGLDETCAEKYLTPGEKQCQWGPVKQAGKCPAHNAHVMDKGLEIFVDGTLGDIAVPAYGSLTEAQETQLLDNADAIIEFLQAIKARRHALAEQGHSTDGWKLVNINTHRKIRKGKDEMARKHLRKLGLHTHDYLTEPSLKSPNQIEQALKRKGHQEKTIKAFKDEYVYQPDGGTKFVPESAPGKAVAPAIEAEFEEFFEDTDDLLEI